MTRDRWMGVAVFAGLVGLCVAGRVMPHESNFTPVAAAALFAGYYFSRRWVAAAVPVLGMLIGDQIIGGYEWEVAAVIYAAFVLSTLLGRWMQRSGLNVWRVAGSSFVGAVAFYLLSNGAHWAFTEMYPHTLAGLIESYVAALPFFRNTLTGDLVWSAGLFGAYGLAVNAIRQARPAANASAALQ